MIAWLELATHKQTTNNLVEDTWRQDNEDSHLMSPPSSFQFCHLQFWFFIHRDVCYWRVPSMTRTVTESSPLDYTIFEHVWTIAECVLNMLGPLPDSGSPAQLRTSTLRHTPNVLLCNVCMETFDSSSLISQVPFLIQKLTDIGISSTEQMANRGALTKITIQSNSLLTTYR